MTIDTDLAKAVQVLAGVDADGIIGNQTLSAIYLKLAGKPFHVDVEQASPASTVPVEVPSGSLVDERSEKAIETLHSRVQPIARQLVRDAASGGIKIIVTSGTRTYAEQDDLYEHGRSKPGSIVTKARGGQSNHNFGVAFDVTVFVGSSPKWDGPEYKTVGSMGKKLGLDWGGDWTSIQDEPHFELRPKWAKEESEGAMLAELRNRHSSGLDAFA